MTQKKNWSIPGMIVGALLMLGPLCGLLGTVLGMLQSFQEISTAQGPAPPQAVAEGIETAMFTTAAGLLLFPLGVVVFVVSLMGYLRSRKRVPH